MLCVGKDNADAFVHCDSACVPGCPVGSEDESSLSGFAIYSHSHRPSAHDNDWQAVLCHGDEMCKFLS